MFYDIDFISTDFSESSASYTGGIFDAHIRPNSQPTGGDENVNEPPGSKMED